MLFHSHRCTRVLLGVYSDDLQAPPLMVNSPSDWGWSSWLALQHGSNVLSVESSKQSTIAWRKRIVPSLSSGIICCLKLRCNLLQLCGSCAFKRMDWMSWWLSERTWWHTKAKVISSGFDLWSAEQWCSLSDIAAIPLQTKIRIGLTSLLRN